MLLIPQFALAARIKDIAAFDGVRENQLIGYGLVVGLNGTGDTDQTKFPVQSLVGALERMGVTVNKSDITVKNIAAVMVTAQLPPSPSRGTGSTCWSPLWATPRASRGERSSWRRSRGPTDRCTRSPRVPS